jgi:hypothetical protein
MVRHYVQGGQRLATNIMPKEKLYKNSKSDFKKKLLYEKQYFDTYIKWNIIDFKQILIFELIVIFLLRGQHRLLLLA